MSDSSSISLDERRKATEALSAWLAREMAAAADRPASGEWSNESAARAIDQCAELLSRFWPSDGSAPCESSPSSSVNDSEAETPSLAFHAMGAAPAQDVLSHEGPSVPSAAIHEHSMAEPQRMPQPGRFGRFEVRRALGRGGFGVVFLVFDPRLNREAALKVPRPEVLISPALRQRFLREAQAAAVLNHPNIVPIYETGEIGPVGYILSAFCNGPTLAGWMHQQAGTIAPRLAADVAATLADAVHHAHSRGILHRDIKPANVLVEPIGEPRSGSLPFVPRLSDFGLAKRVDEATHDTRAGTILGTPQYMAPEQAAGRYREVGVQTDVYGLGVILYELLTGQPPFVGRTDGETLHMIQTQERSPSALRARRVPRDLETICLKTLEREPSARYQSARELAEDLGRFLRGEAVLARSVGRGERLVRWCVRHRAVASLAATVLVALVGGTAVSTYYALAANARAREAQHALAQARNAVDDSFTVISEHALLNEPGMQPLRRQLLETALKYYEDFARTYADNPDLQAELASAHLRAATIHAMIGEHAEAEPLFRKAIATRETLWRASPASADRRRELGDAYAHLATWQGINRRTAETEPLFRRAIALREELARENPAIAGYQQDLAASYHGLADLYRITRGRAEAEPMLRQGTEIRETLAREYPTVPIYQSDLAVSYHTLAVSHADAGRRAEADTFFRKAIDIRETLARHDPTPDALRELAQGCKLLASLQTTNGQHIEAEELFRRAIDIHEKLARQNPTVVRYRRDLAAGYDGLAALQVATGRAAEAELSYHNAIDVQERLTREDPSVAGYHAQLADYCWHLMLLLERDGRAAEARQWRRMETEALESLVREEPSNVHYRFLMACHCLHGAESAAGGGQQTEVQAAYGRAIDLFERLAREAPTNFQNQTHLAEAYEGLAILLASNGRDKEAERDYRSAIDRLRGGTTEDEDDAHETQSALASLHARLAVQTALAGTDCDVVHDEVKQAAAHAPGEAAIQLMCGDAAALVGRWPEAAECYARADDLSGHDWWTMRYQARLLLAADDLAGYRAICARLMDQFASTAMSRQVESIALTCVFGDHALDDMMPVIELSQRGINAEPNNPLAIAALGGALYRSGKLEEATTVLSDARRPPPRASLLAANGRDEIRLGQFYAATFLAMAYRDWGRTDDLLPVVAEIRRQVIEIERDVTPASASIVPWSFRFAVEFARRELGNLLASKEVPSD